MAATRMASSPSCAGSFTGCPPVQVGVPPARFTLMLGRSNDSSGVMVSAMVRAFTGPSAYRRARLMGPGRVNWWLVGLLILNVALAAGTFAGLQHGGDWAVLERAAREAGTPELYTDRNTGTFVWSPVAAYVLQAVVPMGFEWWRVVLIGSAMAMPTWPLRIGVLLSWPFWTDFTTGNLLTVIFLAAVWAWRGSRVGTAAFFALAVLIPRPLFIPMVLWIIWKRPGWRLPAVGMFTIHAVLVLWTGLGFEWIQTVLSTSAELQSIPLNLSPTRFLGYWWWVVGLPLGAWLFWRGHVGWAGLAISNYVWIYYLYWALPWVNGLGLRDPEPARPQHVVGANVRRVAVDAESDPIGL